MSYTHLRTNRVRRARKDHRCWWCGETIPKGSAFVRLVGVYDGDFQSAVYHPECDRALAADEYAQDGYMLYENERPVEATA